MVTKNLNFLGRITACLVLSLLGASPLAAENEVDWAAIGEARAQTSGQSIVGQPLKPYVLETVSGEQIDLAKFIGRQPIYLKFWATWCTTCLAQMPHFDKLAQKYQDQLAVLAVNTGINDDIDDVRTYLQQHQLSMPVVRDDGTLANDLQLTVTPQQVLIDHTGRIVWLGHKDDQRFMDVLDQVANHNYQPAAQSLVKTNEPAIILQSEQLQSAPTFTAINGKSVAIHNKKQATYLWFTSPWCEWYLAESKPNTAAACQAVRELAISNPKQLWLGISIDVWADQGQVEGFVQQHQIRVPFILDDEKTLFTAFAIRDIPAVVVIEPDGRIKKYPFANAIDVAQFAKAVKL